MSIVDQKENLLFSKEIMKVSMKNIKCFYCSGEHT